MNLEEQRKVSEETAEFLFDIIRKKINQCEQKMSDTTTEYENSPDEEKERLLRKGEYWKRKHTHLSRLLSKMKYEYEDYVADNF